MAESGDGEIASRLAPDLAALLARRLAALADEEVAPVSAELDAKHEFPYDLVAKMGQMGLFGLPFDEACMAHHKQRSTVQTASVDQVRNPIYTSSQQRWKRYEKQLSPLIEAIGDSA